MRDEITLRDVNEALQQAFNEVEDVRVDGELVRRELVVDREEYQRREAERRAMRRARTRSRSASRRRSPSGST